MMTEDEDTRILDCLEDPPVRRCTKCHLTKKEHGKGKCLTFTPGQPTLAQVLAYLGMDQDLERFKLWVHLVLEHRSMTERARALFADYIEEFGTDGYDWKSFIDFVVCTTNQDSHFSLDAFYRKRLAERAAAGLTVPE